MPRGRRPGTSTTRDALVEAARHKFAEAGYDGTSIRAIATEAGVDPALAVHFFGSKENLFREALAWPFDPALAAERILGTGADSATLGERLARIFLEMWEAPETRGPLLAVLRGALTHEESASLLREFVADQVFRPLIEVSALRPDLFQIQLAVSHLIGIATLRYGLELEPMKSASVDSIVERVAPVLDRYLATGGTQSSRVIDEA